MDREHDLELGDTASENPQSLDQQSLETEQPISLPDSALERNIKLVQNIFNPHDLIFPFNRKRQLLWSFITAFCLFIGIWGRNLGLFRAVTRFVEFEDIYLMLFLYAYEPTLSLFALMFARYPSSLENSQQMLANHNQKLWAQYRSTAANNNSNSGPIIVLQPTIVQKIAPDLAVIIPTHKSAGFILETLEACLKFVKPEHIFIIDNARQLTPLDNTAHIVKTRNRMINYHWVPHGNKTIALAVGTLAIQARFPEVDKVLVIDSDTPPRGFIPPSPSHWEQAHGFVLPVRAVDSNGGKPLLVSWQDMEYQKSDLWNYFTDAFFGVYKPHGAGSIWKLKALIAIFKVKMNSTRFEDEDGRLGYAAMQLNLRLRMYGLRPLETIAPENLSELWMQRVRSWEMSRHADTLKHLQRFFAINLSNPLENLILKITQFSVIYNNMADWLRLPVFILLSSEESFWLKMLIFIVADVTTNLLWNYGKLRNNPELQVNFKTVISYPLYKFLHQGLSIMGLLRAIFIYIPNAPAFFSISSLLHLGALDLMKIEENTWKGLSDIGCDISSNSRDGRPIERESVRLYQLRRHSSRLSDTVCPDAVQQAKKSSDNSAGPSSEIRSETLSPLYVNSRIAGTNSKNKQEIRAVPVVQFPTNNTPDTFQNAQPKSRSFP